MSETNTIMIHPETTIDDSDSDQEIDVLAVEVVE